MLTNLAAAGDAMPQANDYMAMIVQFAPFVLLIFVFYFFLIRPQKKREKAEKAMRDSIKVGDEIATIGGILGRVVSLKEDKIVIESTANRSKIELYRWAIRGKVQEGVSTSTEAIEQANS